MCILLRRTEVVSLLILLVAVPIAWAQDDDVGEVREESRAAQLREGGIPRAQLLEDDGNANEGTAEGIPLLRSSPTERGISPYLLPPERLRWKLGIYAHNTDTGVVVTRVVPGSAASRTGLEPGDRIVTVDGFQVGWIQDRLYSLGHELQQQGGRHGRVILLIQDVRTNRLVNREVQLDHSSGRR